MEKIRQDLLQKFPDIIQDVLHLHFWTITSNINVISFHIVLEDPNRYLRKSDKCLEGEVECSLNLLITEINTFLKEKYQIQESTIQMDHKTDSFCTL